MPVKRKAGTLNEADERRRIEEFETRFKRIKTEREIRRTEAAAPEPHPLVEGGFVDLWIGRDATNIIYGYCDEATRDFIDMHRSDNVPELIHRLTKEATDVSWVSRTWHDTVESNIKCAASVVMSHTDAVTDKIPTDIFNRTHSWMTSLKHTVDEAINLLDRHQLKVAYVDALREWLIGDKLSPGRVAHRLAPLCPVLLNCQTLFDTLRDIEIVELTHDDHIAAGSAGYKVVFHSIPVSVADGGSLWMEFSIDREFKNETSSQAIAVQMAPSVTPYRYKHKKDVIPWGDIHPLNTVGQPPVMQYDALWDNTTMIIDQVLKTPLFGARQWACVWLLLLDCMKNSYLFSGSTDNMCAAVLNE